MKDVYRGYYPLSDDEIDGLWANGLVVVDTNVLLDFYRFTPASRRAIYDSLIGVKNRLWLPHQVGLEFHKMRREVRQEAQKAHAATANRIVSETAKVRKLADQAANLNGSVDSDASLRDALTEAARLLSEAVKKGQDPFKEASQGDDDVLAVVEGLFLAHQLGQRFTKAELDGLRLEAEERYSRRIPPGYEDQNKPADAAFGDFFLWKQMIAEARTKKVGVIFITSDEKPDWKQEGRARPELLQEFFEETGQLIHIYNPKSFTDAAKQRDLWKPDSDNEAAEVAAELDEFVRKESSSLGFYKFYSGILDETHASIAEGLGRIPFVAPPVGTVIGNGWLPKATWANIIEANKFVHGPGRTWFFDPRGALNGEMPDGLSDDEDERSGNATPSDEDEHGGDSPEAGVPTAG